MWSHSAVFICLFFRLTFVTSQTDDLGEVVFVSFLFRHGDRTPIDPYPNDPYKNNSLWPAEWGELTDIGKRGHYKLGKWLRARYADLLPTKYDRKDIYIQSTDVDRTLMSAYSNLAGLYEPDPKSNWNPDIRWNPIPVHTVPENLDKVLAAKAPCPKYNVEFEKVKNSRAVKNLNEKNKKLYQYLSQYSGMNVTSVLDVTRLYDTLFIEELYNFTLPNWTKSVYPRPLESLAAFTFSMFCYTVTMARLKVGPLLSQILEHMQDHISGKLSRKAWMYSAHDITVANVLKALNLFQPHCPPYLSLILFELRKKDEKYFVALHYRNSSSSPYLMQLPGCDKLCPFEKFEDLISPLIPDDWDGECRTSLNSFERKASISFMTSVSVSFIFLVCLISIVRFYKSQKWNQNEFAYKSLNKEIPS